ISPARRPHPRGPGCEASLRVARRLPTSGRGGLDSRARSRGQGQRSPALEGHVIVHSRLESSHLAGNLLGDPSERDLFVYLPPGYGESDRRYPAAYLLQAYGTTAAEIVTPATDEVRWRPPIEDVLEPV